MICSKCGTTIDDEAVFCPECGARLAEQGGETPMVPDSGIELTPQAVPTAFAEGQPAEPKRSQHRKTGIIAAAVACVMVLAGVGGYAAYQAYQADQQRQAAEQQKALAQELHAVIVPFTAPGYDSATCSKVPVHATGTDSLGNAVDQMAYIDGTGQGLSLPRGEYTIVVVVSPLLADGSFYATPDPIALHIDDSVGSGDSYTVMTPLTFAPVDITTVTDQQIQSAYDNAIAAGMERTVADNLKATLVNARQAAIDAAAAAEAQRQAEAAAAALKAQYHISTDYYEFDIPEYWYGRVNVVRSGTKTSVYALSDSKENDALMWVEVDQQANAAGDIGTHRLFKQAGSSGSYVVLFAQNFPWIIWSEAQSKSSTKTRSDDVEADLVDLSSGGAISLSKARAAEPKTMYDQDFLNSTLIPTLTVK